MSFKAMDRVFDASRQKGAKFVLLLAIADYARDDGTGAWPRRDTLARMTTLTEVRVGRLINELVADGELRVHHGKAPHGGDLYDVVFPDTPTARCAR